MLPLPKLTKSIYTDFVINNLEKGKTKIIATIGPASESADMLRSLIARGMDVARLNTKHNEPDWHLGMIKRIRKVSKEMGVRVGILLDLQGPEIRAENYDGLSVGIKSGSRYVLTSKQADNFNELYIPFPEVINSLQENQEVSLNDGGVIFKVESVKNEQAILVAQNDFELGNRKTVNIPGLTAPIPSLTKRDEEYLKIIETEPVDFVGLSFVRTKKDMEHLRDKLEKAKSKAHIIAKIETRLALENIKEIISEADAVMVARGDLGIENPIEEIAFWQKKIIRQCRDLDTPVIVATQMLKSMLTSPTPSRAESTDIANAVFDGTDAIMLSEETAMGNHPEKAVSAMARISHFNEKHHELYDNFMPNPTGAVEAFTGTAAHFIEKGSIFNLDKVVVFTETGFTARALSAYRPKYPVIAVTDRLETANQLSLVYGIIPVLTKLPSGIISVKNIPTQKLIDSKVIKPGETILVIHGKKWKEPGETSILAFVKV